MWALDDAFLAPLFPRRVRAAAGAAAGEAAALKRALTRACLPCGARREAGLPAAALAHAALRLRAVPAAALLLAAAWNAPIAANLLSRAQAMNRSFGAWHLCNTYGAFGVVGKVRAEVVWAGLGEDGAWREFAFACKPGALSRTPCWVTPYHLRLDWLMWFSAMGTYQQYPWAVTLAQAMLEEAPRPLPPLAAALRAAGAPLAVDARDLLAHGHPFQGGRPPSMLRADLFEYRFSPRALAAAARAGASAGALCAALPVYWGWGRDCAAGEGAGALIVGGHEVAVGAVWARRKVGSWLPILEAGNPSLAAAAEQVRRSAPQF